MILNTVIGFYNFRGIYLKDKKEQRRTQNKKSETYFSNQIVYRTVGIIILDVYCGVKKNSNQVGVVKIWDFWHKKKKIKKACSIKLKLILKNLVVQIWTGIYQYESMIHIFLKIQI